MRNFDWSHRIFHVLGGIVEALIILMALAVIAGVIFLLVRYLLVATKAAQLYVDHHQPRHEAPLAPAASTPGPPAPATPAPTTPSAPSASTTVTKPSPTRAKTEPTSKPAPKAGKPRSPKTPPSK